MTAGADTIPVEQVDRDAVQAFHREMAARLMAEIKGGDPIVNGHDGDAIHQAFARHRVRARTEVDQVREALALVLNHPLIRLTGDVEAKIRAALTGSNPAVNGSEGHQEKNDG